MELELNPDKTIVRLEVNIFISRGGTVMVAAPPY